MKYHTLGAFLAFAAILLISAIAPSIDKATGTLDYNNLRGAAKFQAREAVKP